MNPPRKAGGGQRKPFGSTDTTYYPDLVDGGGLTSVLQAVAVAGGYDVGRIDGQSSAEFGGYVQAVIDTGTGKILFGIAADRRLFSVQIFVGSLGVASGGTPEIPGVLAVAAAWRSGISYEEIEARFPFMRVLELARVLAASDPVAAMWDWLLGDEVFVSWRPVVEGAHRHPVLRTFFPDFQLHKFTLSRGHHRQPGDARPPDDGVVAIWPHRPDGYGVERWGTRPARADCPSLDEALAAAARLLTGLSPERLTIIAVLGTEVAGDAVHLGVALFDEEQGAFGARDIAVMQRLGRLLCRQAALVVQLPHPPGWAARLARREAEVARLAGRGCTSREIAAALDITIDTVKKHVKAACHKAGAANILCGGG